MIGVESTSSNKYDPPCKSSPKLNFFDKTGVSVTFIKFSKEKNDKEMMMKYIMSNFSFEKYNTKCNYFFVLGLNNKLCKLIGFESVDIISGRFVLRTYARWRKATAKAKEKKTMPTPKLKRVLKLKLKLNLKRKLNIKLKLMVKLKLKLSRKLKLKLKQKLKLTLKQTSNSKLKLKLEQNKRAKA